MNSTDVINSKKPSNSIRFKLHLSWQFFRI